MVQFIFKLETGPEVGTGELSLNPGTLYFGILSLPLTCKARLQQFINI